MDYKAYYSHVRNTQNHKVDVMMLWHLDYVLDKICLVCLFMLWNYSAIILQVFVFFMVNNNE